MHIRKAQLSDLARLVEHNQMMAQETEDRTLDHDTLKAGLQAVLHDPNKGFYLVAEDNGAVIANLMITFEWSDWRNGQMWWFQSVFVRPEARGQGVFARMYAHVLDMAKAEGVKELRLYVEKTNVRAQEVYRRLGMEASHYDMWEVEV